MLLFARQNVTSFLNASASKIMCRNDTHPVTASKRGLPSSSTRFSSSLSFSPAAPIARCASKFFSICSINCHFHGLSGAMDSVKLTAGTVSLIGTR